MFKKIMLEEILVGNETKYFIENKNVVMFTRATFGKKI